MGANGHERVQKGTDGCRMVQMGICQQDLQLLVLSYLQAYHKLLWFPTDIIFGAPPLSAVHDGIEYQIF